MNINDFNTKVEALMSLNKRTLAELVALHEFSDENKKWCPGISVPPMNVNDIYVPECDGKVTITPVSKNDFTQTRTTDGTITAQA